MSAPTLLWLHIHQYEQFDDVRIRFSPRENLLLGVNGAGKTRLLKLIRAVLTLEFGELLSRPFDVEFEFLSVPAMSPAADIQVTGRVTNVRGPARNSTDRPSFQPPMELAASLSYQCDDAELCCDVHGNEISYHQAQAPLEVEKSLLSEAGSLKPSPGNLRNRTLRAICERLSPRCKANYLGESDHEFRILSQAISFTKEGDGMAIIRNDEKGENLTEPLYSDLFPLIISVGLVDQRNFKGGLDLARPGVFNLAVRVDDAAFPCLFATLGIRTVRLIPKITREKGARFECRGIEVNVEFLDGTRLSESELTFGQRRYLYAGIVFALHPGVPVLVDELDNGLHPGLIATLLGLWQDRQLFLVSHNKLVIDHTNFAGPGDVQDKIHIIRRGEDGRQTVLALDEAAAHEVYEKIAVAIQSPSDVLRAEGLW